ncbi:predicted protein [Chaetoceros tenuissimus]|uniref:Uncharacterized protein n=1 Tax=Chaetoceros tenuissimus TaxID=426638 RepID=A0AAD3D564_9STRA|nr:predicted protein [Chaetoceros tenuissimus]
MNPFSLSLFSNRILVVRIWSFPSSPAPTQNCTLQATKETCQLNSYCSWGGGKVKSCSFNNSSPVSSPVAEPPVGGPTQCAAVGESCRESVDCCSGACSGGKPADRVCLA